MKNQSRIQIKQYGPDGRKVFHEEVPLLDTTPAEKINWMLTINTEGRVVTMHSQPYGKQAQETSHD